MKRELKAKTKKKLAKVDAASSARAEELERRVSTEKPRAGKRRGKGGAILDS